VKQRARLALAAGALCAASATAQVATDGSVGARQSFVGNNITIPASLGQRIRSNLFHSFQVFNVATGQTVNFAPGAVTLETPVMSNIIGRVTGGTASTIQGTVRSTASGVNLYLINPSGFVFGPGALVDVNGSFYASSAHYLRSADGTKFESRGPGVSLTFTTPDGFGFDSATVAPIAVQGAVLRAREGGTVGLVGGGILVGGAPASTSLQALSGNAIVVAVASPGVVEQGAAGTTLNGFGGMADVLLQRGAVVNVNEGGSRTGGGSVFIRGNNIALDQATVTARSTFGSGRQIDIAASRDLTINKSNVVAVTTGAGNAGRIRIGGNNVVVSEGSLVDTSCDPGCTTGNGGLLELRAGDLLLVDGTAGTTFIVSNSFGSGRTGEIDVVAGRLVIDGAGFIQGIGLRDGDATAIRIHSGDILLRNGAQIDASARGTGRGGQISVDNSGAVTIIGSRADPTQNGLITPSGIFTNTTGTGDAGGIVVATRTLDILGGGEISSTALRGSTGAGGSIAITASEAIRVSGVSADSTPSGIATNTVGSGNAGAISLAAPVIVINDRGVVQSQSEGAGRSGQLRVAARDLTLAGRGQLSTDARSTGDSGSIDVTVTGTLFITGGNTGIFAKTYGPALGGDITVDAARVVIENDGVITAATDGAGRAGRIRVHTGDLLSMDTGGAILSGTTKGGDAGSIFIRSDRRIALARGARIVTSTNDEGDAGAIFVSAADEITLSASQIISESLHAPGRTVTGRAGSIEVKTGGRLGLRDGSRISTSTTTYGDAGNVTLHGAESIEISSNAVVASESSGAGLAGDLDVSSNGRIEIANGGRITTSATFSDGGNISVAAPLAFMNGGRITAAVGTGLGDGGNMEIRISTFVLRDSVITANAFGGHGGNIHIATDKLLKSTNSSITASSQLGVDGTITLDSPAIDPTGELLAPLPSFLDAGAILAGRCGPRLAGRASSLVIVARGAETSAVGGLRAWLERNTPSCEAPQPSS
jgi:filamentous hemagglutinin family protein